MTKYPLVEVRCENCTHYGTSRTLYSIVTPFCRKGAQPQFFMKYPCNQFQFKAKAGWWALVHRTRLENGLDRQDELDRLTEGGRP